MVKVIISGATGFVAQHIVSQLLKSNYSVIGTVRSESKGQNLKSKFNNDNFQFEIVEDVEKAGAFDKTLQNHQDATVFLHTASPFHFRATDIEKELLLPAINGTKNALEAITKYGENIKRVVITSSYAAIGTASIDADPKNTITEDDWNLVTWEEALSNPVTGYRGSKTFAEKAAWEFYKENKPKWKLSTVNPSFIFGPQFNSDGVKATLNTSSEVINNILKLGPDGQLPPFKGGWVDVRDVAKAHIVAFEKDSAIDQRLLLNQSRFATQSIIDIINENFESLRGKIPKGDPGSDKKIIATQLAKVDNSKTLKILGFELIDLKTSVIDSVQQIIDVRKGNL
ncbi:unnamed protein product [Candida verbasci]|uniref:NAD-dependent epimerase/dehydratase domain-containing protein n=1 Tax=Candida verbasci TaxID=1227364 RepID=A0A9W4XCE7_9ASCO|nr:unnamed protein product [Candida verbasci]